MRMGQMARPIVTYKNAETATPRLHTLRSAKYAVAELKTQTAPLF